VPVDLTPGKAAACLRTHGFVFLFAPTSHPTMRRVQPVRRALGFRNTFHLAGPLSNPAGAQAQLMGVFAKERVQLVAETMARLDVRHGWVVHGEDGLDELTLTGTTMVAEVRDGTIRTHEVAPEQLGLCRVSVEALKGAESAEGNAQILAQILKGTASSAQRDVVLLNAGACLTVAGISADLLDGIAQSRSAIQSGSAWYLLEALRAFKHQGDTAPLPR
jgi:anthranilate phosphoribosyltransferase